MWARWKKKFGSGLGDTEDSIGTHDKYSYSRRCTCWYEWFVKHLRQHSEPRHFYGFSRLLRLIHIFHGSFLPLSEGTSENTRICSNSQKVNKWCFKSQQALYGFHFIEYAGKKKSCLASIQYKERKTSSLLKEFSLLWLAVHAKVLSHNCIHKIISNWHSISIALEELKEKEVVVFAMCVNTLKSLISDDHLNKFIVFPLLLSVFPYHPESINFNARHCVQADVYIKKLPLSTLLPARRTMEQQKCRWHCSLIVRNGLFRAAIHAMFS